MFILREFGLIKNQIYVSLATDKLLYFCYKLNAFYFSKWRILSIFYYCHLYSFFSSFSILSWLLAFQVIDYVTYIYWVHSISQKRETPIGMLEWIRECWPLIYCMCKIYMQISIIWIADSVCYFSRMLGIALINVFTLRKKIIPPFWVQLRKLNRQNQI